MDHGKFAEDTLELICSRMFGKALVYKSPYTNTEAGKKVELTDILILAGDTIITIQSKSIDIEVSKADQIHAKRVLNKYEKAKKQLNRTLNAANRDVDVKLKTITDVEFEIPWTLIKNKIGIVTVNVNDELYEDPDFRYQLPLKHETHRDIDIHAFILRDLYVLLTEINTYGDFVNFLNDRKEILKRTVQDYVNELDFLALWCSNYDKIEEIKNLIVGKVILQPGIWEEYRKTKLEEIKKRDRKKFRLTIVELMINEFSSHLDYYLEQNPDEQKLAIESMLTIVGELSKLTRTQRIIIDETFRKKYESTDKEELRYFSLPIKTIAYLFIITNERNREIRQEKLLQMSCSLCKSMDKNDNLENVNRILAIATEGRNAPGRSFDGIIIEREHCRELLEDNDIPDIFKYRDEGTTDEWSI